jgi:hypothetical protein
VKYGSVVLNTTVRLYLLVSSWIPSEVAGTEGILLLDAGSQAQAVSR